MVCGVVVPARRQAGPNPPFWTPTHGQFSLVLPSPLPAPALAVPPRVKGSPLPTVLSLCPRRPLRRELLPRCPCPRGARRGDDPKAGGVRAAAALRHVAALIVATLFTRCHGDAAADQNKRRSEGLGGPPRARRHANGEGRRERGRGVFSLWPSGPPAHRGPP